MNSPEVFHRYAISGGKEGKERLNVLARVMLPTTSQLLNRVGLTKGMTCLDVGCGGGHVTLFMANMVGSEGKITGTDADREIIALAKEDAETAGIGNVEFYEVNACVCRWHKEYDLVYARFLLSHLSEPDACLRAMVEACRPTGTIVVEDIDCAGCFCYPHRAAYERSIELYKRVVERRGGDPDLGPKLPRMLRKAGAVGVQLSVVQPTFIEGEGKLMASITMDRISGAVISEGLADRSEVQQIIDGLNAAAADPETVMSVPRVFQVWGKRASSH
jgi:SAM-dependent methyltransferase